MSYRGYNGVQCDWPGCTTSITTDRGSPDKVRAEAADKGWAYIEDFDLCPDHTLPPTHVHVEGQDDGY